MRPVGVLGGMGPEATVHFMGRVLKAVDAKDDSDHVPLLVDQNPQVPSRIAALLNGGGEDPGPVLNEMARRLAAAGARALVMPCNTAHHYAPVVQGAVPIPFISMVELAAARAAELTPDGAIGLLGSPALEKIGVFDAPIAARGLRIVPLERPDAALHAIREIKAGGVTRDISASLNRQAEAQIEAGAQAICLCCTEFSLAAETISAPVPVFDALDLLVDATVRFAREGVLPPAQSANAENNLNREKEPT